MKSLRPNYERTLFAAGYKLVAGADEVGRGALAGPLVAAVVLFDKSAIFRFARNVKCPVRDSKLLSALQRERIFPLIKKYACATAVGQVSHREIDKHGMGWAAKEVFYRLLSKLKIKDQRSKILVDGVDIWRPGLRRPGARPLDIESIIHGDSKIFSIAAASIYAKVYRDRLMRRYAKKYPQYGFERHVGYGTAAHRATIAKYGLCPLHRRSFRTF